MCKIQILLDPNQITPFPQRDQGAISPPEKNAKRLSSPAPVPNPQINLFEQNELAAKNLVLLQAWYIL
jgi:hypothetical protein